MRREIRVVAVGREPGGYLLRESAPLQAVEVVNVRHPQHALDSVQAIKADVVLLDATGATARDDTLYQLRMLAPLTKALVSAGPPDACAVRDCFLAGAVGYLTGDVDDLAPAIHLAMSGYSVAPSEALAEVIGRVPATQTALSEMDLRVLALAAEGLNLDDIGATVNVSRATAARLIAQIQSKVGVSNRDQMVALAARRGWV